MKNVYLEVVVDGKSKMVEGARIVEALDLILEQHSNLTKNAEGLYETNVYVDYRDELSEVSLQKIVSAEKPRDTFYDIVNESATDYLMDEENNILDIIYKYWDEEVYGDFEQYREFIDDWRFENIIVNFPYDHFLNNEVKLNVCVDTGDGNYDYTLNNFLAYNAEEEEYKEIDRESSILWLLKQQGYDEKQLIEAIEQGTSDTFLKSLIQELTNVTTSMNVLTFFISITLEEYFSFKEAKEVTLSKTVNCGLADFWNGAGSTLEIELNQDVRIPMDIVKAHADGGRGYGIEKIYGMSDRFWTDSIVKLTK